VRLDLQEIAHLTDAIVMFSHSTLLGDKKLRIASRIMMATKAQG
jgi:hypothetical protein